MASLVKTKVGISVFSIGLIVAVPMLQTNFFAPVTIREWSQGDLEWSDFKGIVPLLDPYDAAIHSDIILKYDSTLKTFYAYAVQNDQQSWVRSDVEWSEDLLRHEQYHFNITEWHTRMMNDLITANPDLSSLHYKEKLASVRFELWDMQGKYDRQTNHSTIVPQQHHWEYFLDSLLTLKPGWMRDSRTGATVYFSSIPDIINETHDEVNVWGFGLERYGMRFRLLIAEHMGIKERNIFKKDSANLKFVSNVFFDDKYFYEVLAVYKSESDTTPYHKMAKSFVNSFSLPPTPSNTDQPLPHY